jgi:hypothetical protein
MNAPRDKHRYRHGPPFLIIRDRRWRSPAGSPKTSPDCGERAAKSRGALEVLTPCHRAG